MVCLDEEIDKYIELHKCWDLHSYHLKSYHFLIFLFGYDFLLKKMMGIVIFILSFISLFTKKNPLTHLSNFFSKEKN